jgi:hypothetical protein
MEQSPLRSKVKSRRQKKQWCFKKTLVQNRLANPHNMASHRRRYAIHGDNDPPSAIWDSSWEAKPVQASLRFSSFGPISGHYANPENMGSMPDWLYESTGNIYRNGSQTCCSNGKTYRDAQLGELVHSITVEHVLEHELICGSEPAGGKREEGETAADRQPSRASGVFSKYRI